MTPVFPRSSCGMLAWLESDGEEQDIAEDVGARRVPVVVLDPYRIQSGPRDVTTQKPG